MSAQEMDHALAPAGLLNDQLALTPQNPLDARPLAGAEIRRRIGKGCSQQFNGAIPG